VAQLRSGEGMGPRVGGQGVAGQICKQMGEHAGKEVLYVCVAWL
jgi:hypothetical protein